MQTRVLRILPTIFALFIAGLGGLVMFAWIAHIPSLIKLHPNLAPMQFNTALAMFLAAMGLGLLQFKNGWKRVAAFPAVGTFCLGMITNLQYLLHLNFGIDEWTVPYFLTMNPLHPGRMASNTAICFVLAGFAIFILSRRRSSENGGRQLSIFIGTAICVFAFLSLFGFVVTLPAEFLWSNFSSMALQTAVGFTLIGAGIILTSGRVGGEEKRSFQDFVPSLVVGSVLLGAIVVWQAALLNEARELHQSTVSKSEAVRAQLVQGLEDRILSIERMASRLAFEKDPSKTAWKSDAELYVKHLGVIETFGVVGANYRVKWIYPEGSNLRFINLDISADPIRKSALDKAKSTHSPQLSPILDLKQGGRGFVMYFPLYHQGQFLGSLSASIRPSVFFAHVINSEGYEIRIHSDQELLYESKDAGHSNPLWSVTAPISLYDHVWMMEVTPTLESIRSSESTIPYVILVTGVFAALILGFLAQLSITARKQSFIIGEQKIFVDGVIQNSPLPIVVIGKDHRVQMWNPACVRVFGWSYEEAIGKFLQTVPPDSDVQSHVLIEKIFNSAERVEAEAMRLTKDGRSVPVRIAAHALRDNQNRTYGLVAVMDDLTERKKSEQEIREAHALAEKAAQVKSEFLANMSHEIRTPLNGIIGMADLMLLTQLTEDQKRYAKIIQNSGSSLLTLINDILDFSKMEAGKIQLEDLDFSLVSLVETQADLMIAKARKKGLVLTTFISPNLPALVRGDSGRIGQVLLNLLGNAIKFTHSGSIAMNAVEVQSPLKTAGPVRVRFEVSDTGIGLSPESSSKLFLPFSQVDGSTARKFGGTGLGLSISKSIVAAMGGVIGISSAEREGSTFWFELEFNRIRDQKLSPLDRKVLVLEEDQISSEAILRYLSAWRMEGRSTDRISEAVDILKAAMDEGKPYDAVLLGKKCQEFVQIFGPNPPKIILLTEFEDPAPPAGMTVFSGRITKPVKQSELYDKLVKIHLQANSEWMTHKNPVPIADAKKLASGLRVLVADDVAANQLLAVKFLEFLGYQAQAVGNGLEVLEQLERSHFDLILMDCQMPEMDGFEATQKIRALQDERLSKIPIVALTANAMGGDDKKCLAAGMDDYLSKPFKKEKLGEILEKWLTQKAGR